MRRPESPAHLLARALRVAVLAAIAAAVAVPATAAAVPAAPWSQAHAQADGSEVTYYLHGDERFSYRTDADGALLQRDPVTGDLCYVMRSADGSLMLGEPASDAPGPSGRAASAGSALADAGDLADEAARTAYAALANEGPGVDIHMDAPLVTLNGRATFSFSDSLETLTPPKDGIPLLNIVIGFTGGAEGESGEEPYRDDIDWHQRIFEDEYSVARYWSDASTGRFTFTPAQEQSAYGVNGTTNTADAPNDGIVHITLEEPHENWSGVDTEDVFIDFVRMTDRALKKVQDAGLIDLPSFDANGDGRLENNEFAINFIVAGGESAAGENHAHNLWAHAGSFTDAELTELKVFNVDGVTLPRYVAMAEQQFYADPEAPGGILAVPATSNTLTHELGHYLGLPDLYDTAYGEGNAWSDYEVYGLSLMDYGAWGADHSDAEGYGPDEITSIPTRLDPVCSWLLGFSAPIEITVEGVFEAPSGIVDGSYRFFAVPVEGADDEFFLIENRVPEGFDEGLKGIYYVEGENGRNDFAGGVVVWHFDAGVWESNTAMNSVNNTDHRPALMPVYPECAGSDGSTQVDLAHPFRTKDYLDDLGDGFWSDVLLRYGTEDPDDPAARTPSGVGVTATGAASSVASFKVTVADLAFTSASPTILFTNDVHGAGLDPDAEGLTYASVAALRNDAAAVAGEANVLVVDAGDAVQGDALATLSEGSIPVAAMGSAGYDLAVPGNHEFDYGRDRFLELVDDAAGEGIAYLAANIDDRTKPASDNPFQNLLVQPGAGVVRVNDRGAIRDIGIVGITTPETLTKSRPSNFTDADGNRIVGFCEDATGEALYARVQAAVDALKDQGCDYVIAIGHLGNRGVEERWSSKAVIAHTTGIDVLIDGHSHEQVSERIESADGQEVLLVQTGTKLASIGRLTFDNGAFTADFVTADTYAKKDAQTTAVLAELNERYGDILAQEVAISQVDMSWEDASGLRLATVGETNLGDLVADAYRAAMGADIGLTNAGGLRAPIAAGPVTYGDVLSVQPYGNEIVMVEATGRQILDALEMGARSYPEGNNALLQVSGLAYAIDPSIPPSVVTDAAGNFVRVDGERRVHSVMVGGAPIDPQATYTVASHNFLLLEGGDGMTMFKGCPVLVSEGAIDVQVLMDYIQDSLGGVIGGRYANPAGEGRIVEAKAPASSGGTSGGSAGSGGDHTGGLPRDTENLAATGDRAAALAGFAVVAGAVSLAAGSAVRRRAS